MEFKKKDERSTNQISVYSFNKIMRVFSTELHQFELEALTKDLDPKETKLLMY